MLRILTGRAGSGKTTEIFRRMAAEASSANRSYCCRNRRPLRRSSASAGRTETGRGCMERSSPLPVWKTASSPWPGAWPSLCWTRAGRLLTMYAALRSVSAHLTVYAMPSRRPEFLGSLSPPWMS